MESGVVGPEQSAVELCGVLVFLLYGGEMFIADDFHGQAVGALSEQSRHIEPAPHEGAVNAAQTLSVEEHARLPVDTVEVEPLLRSVGQVGDLKLVTVPEIGAEERLRYLVHIVGIIGVRHGADVQVGSQYGARHRGRYPVVTVELCRGDFLTSCHHL